MDFFQNNKKKNKIRYLSIAQDVDHAPPVDLVTKDIVIVVIAVNETVVAIEMVFREMKKILDAMIDEVAPILIQKYLDQIQPIQLSIHNCINRISHLLQI